MSKTAHIVAVEIEGMGEGFIECDPRPALQDMPSWIGPRQLLETLDYQQHPQRPEMRQVIPYIIVTDGEARPLVYERGAAGNEARLHGKLAIGVGGHVDLEDAKITKDGALDLFATISCSSLREIEEEIGVKAGPDAIRWTGLIRINEGEVDRVHLGVVGELNLASTGHGEIAVEIQNARFMSYDELKDQSDQGRVLEAWTAAILKGKTQ